MPNPLNEAPQNEKTTDSESPKTLDLEIAPIESITRAEVDVQISTAHQYPRSLAQFYKRAEAMVTVDEETAQSCFYQLRRKDRTAPGGYKLIEGESIRMAEIVAANFGNLRSAVHVVGHTPTRVTVRAVCHDLETNNLIAVEKQTKTTYSDGSPYNEDMAITATNALVSKALRDAIFRVVPKALIKPLKEKAKLVAFGSGATFVERRKKALDWANKTRSVPLERVFAALGVKGEEDITVAHLEVLTGLKNAIMEGDQTVDEAFPPIDGALKPVAEHPEVSKQRTTQAQKEKASPVQPAKTDVKPVTPTPPVVLENPPPPQDWNMVAQEQAVRAAQAAQTPSTSPPTQPNATPPEDEKTLAEAGLAPAQPAPENVVPMQQPETTPEPQPQPAPEPETAPAVQSKELSPAQAKLRDELSAAGFTFDHMVNALSGKIGGIPKKTDPRCPKDFAGLDEKTADWLSKNAKGVVGAIKAAMASKTKS